MIQDIRNGLQEIIDDALYKMRADAGPDFDLAHINLAQFCRITGISRSKARTIQAHGFKVLPHGRTGMKASSTVLSGFEEALDKLLISGVTNSSVCYDRLVSQGYTGGITTIKNYIARHADLIPVSRKQTQSQQTRARRYQTAPGEMFQMDWGFINVADDEGTAFRIACFAMVCHSCGLFYIEFFPNARQESLFIGMIHGFLLLGVPKFVLTDNMTSVVIGRGIAGEPLWNHNYATFMNTIGFKTKLCKPRHPRTKGAVERLIFYVKDNFAAGRVFKNITLLNQEALIWCANKANRHKRFSDTVPALSHEMKCFEKTGVVDRGAVANYLCPRRKISFDGFVSYEGRRFGVPYWYTTKYARVNREGEFLHIYSDDLSQELAVHPVTWLHSDSFCENQFAESEPYELPSVPVTTEIKLVKDTICDPDFARFDFSGGQVW